MNTPPFSKETAKNPLINPTGESVHELIGESTSSMPDPQTQPSGAPALGANHSLAQISIAPGASSKAHYHKICHESYYILSGRATMRVDEQEFELKPGQACLILPGQVHQIVNADSQVLEFLAVCVPAWFASDSVYV